MLEELRVYSSLGNRGYYWELLNLFYDQPNRDWDSGLLEGHFHNRIIDGLSVFDGAIPLLLLIGVLEKDINGIYHPTFQFRHRLHTIDHCKSKLLDALIKALGEDAQTYDIFSAEFCTLDLINNAIQVNKSAFGLRYATIRDVLIDLGFLLPHPNYPEQSYIIHRANKKLFDKYLVIEMRKRTLTPEQLRGIQAAQQENGLRGEQFVIEFESRRTGRGEEIEWIANYDASAGFDIMSFDTAMSPLHDRFIEVKAYSGSQPYFYWSRNELEVAREKAKQYYLYLVNIDETSAPDYKPIILQNPSESVLENDEWQKMVEKYHIVQSVDLPQEL